MGSLGDTTTTRSPTRTEPITLPGCTRYCSSPSAFKPAVVMVALKTDSSCFRSATDSRSGVDVRHSVS